jgi:hypothetical protein
LVGHTHAQIDQHFGVCATRIHNAKFIPSPPALWDLLEANTGTYTSKSRFKPPVKSYLVTVVHDYKSALGPYFDQSIQYLGVPYNYRFRCVGGIGSIIIYYYYHYYYYYIKFIINNANYYYLLLFIKGLWKLKCL